MLFCWCSSKNEPEKINKRKSAMIPKPNRSCKQRGLLESTPEREARPAAGEDERPAAPLQDVGRGPPRAEAAR